MRLPSPTSRWLLPAAAAALALSAAPNLSRAAEDCAEGEFSSTFELIQKVIFERNGCTESICHGSAASGGLDLSPNVAYDNLIDVPSTTAPGMPRVMVGQKDRSLLWINLAAKTLPDEWHAPLRAMPLDPLPAISTDELDALRIWIEAGAPRTGVIRGTDELLDACLPPPEPVEIKPLPPPAPGEGVQIHMPQWSIGGKSETEVCFASYYDVSEQVPAKYRSADGKSFRFYRSETRQDALSHHLIVNRYEGVAAPNDPVWGTYRCRGGARDGEICDPLDIAFCGADSGCGTDRTTTLACVGFGPGDTGVGIAAAGVVSTQETASDNRFPEGVYAELPMKGIMLWDSHAFNLSEKGGKLEAWINFYFAESESHQRPVQLIFNTEKVFAIDAPAFGTDEVCHAQILPPHAQVYELSSHVHRHGQHFRTYLGDWRCQGGPADGKHCDPNSETGMCGSGQCASSEHLRRCDCNRDRAVTVDELVTTVNIALGSMGMEMCEESDIDANGRVSVDELVTGINGALTGIETERPRDVDESLLYINYIYNDPIVLRLDEPIAMPGGQSSESERSLTYCALFDNGVIDPTSVKRKSTSPPPPLSVGNLGGPCATATHCTAGKVGEACSGRGVAARHRSCDTAPGSGDGECDACPLTGGATSEDEMFILIGQYFLP